MGGGAKALLNKKAFTLIELLAVIVILAIIALIATPQIMKIIKEAQDKSLEATKNSIIKASELYVVRNLDKFALAEGEKTYIQLSELEDGYVKKIKNSGGESCEGYVKVEKTRDDFDYTVYLDCGNGDNLLVDSSYVNYGGNYLDEFQDVIKTKDDGYLAVGRSNSDEFSGNQRHGENINYDAIIVKYDKNGLEEWSRNFGGTSDDYFYSVIDDGSGYVTVGRSMSQDGDMETVAQKAFSSILVKYDYKGNLISKMIVTDSISSFTAARKILYKDGYYYVIGDGRYVLSSNMQLGYIAKYDSNFNKQWIKTYGGTRSSYVYGAIFNKDGNIVLAGETGSIDGDMTEIKIGARDNMDAIILVVNSINGNLIDKGIFGGTFGADRFNDVVEVDDGYIIAGESGSNDHDMEGIYNGGGDAIVVKYGKNPVNGVLPIIWKKSFGGTSLDKFVRIIKRSDNLLLVGYSNSKNVDLLNITKTNNTDYDALLIKINSNGEIISKTTYGGSKSDYLYSGLYNNGKYILVGNSFSGDGDIESFNLGNSDAVLVSVDNELKTTDIFKLETLLMSKQKELIVNYGVSIPQPQNIETLKLYTTNDATKDLGGWCDSSKYVYPTSNYKYAQCLRPFDGGDVKGHLNLAINSSNLITVTPNGVNNWFRLHFTFGNINNGEMSNLKIKFEGKEFVTISEAVNLKYIEPLSIVGAISSYQNYYFPNSFNLLSGGSSGEGSFPFVSILIKPKNYKLEKISFDSNGNYSITQARVVIDEYLNFDISLTPNNS